MTRKGHRLWKHPNGYWYILYGPRLKRHFSTGTKDQAQAELIVSQFAAGAKEVAKNSVTVDVLLSRYYRDRLPEVRSPNAIKFAVRALESRLGPFRPFDLLPAVIKRYARERGASDGTILREIGVLRAALAWAVENQWLAAAPIISNPVKVPLPRERWITRGEADRLLAACHQPHLRLFVLLGLMTVARTSAILEAKWDQIDWEQRRIDYGPGHGNKRRAVVPLNDGIYDALLSAKRLASSDYIVAHNGRAITTIKTSFAAACERAGLKDVTPHILRHTGATWMAIAGVPIDEIARMLGDSVKTTEHVYAKHSPEYLRRAAAALEL